MKPDLNEQDIRILELLQEQADLSTTDIGQIINLSQSPCWRRIQRLRSEGYIRKQVALLDRRKLGESFFIFASLTMTTLDEASRGRFLARIAEIPEIMECYTLFGERDVLIKVYARSMSWYQEFTFNVLLKLPGVVDIQSMATMTEIKCTTALPLR